MIFNIFFDGGNLVRGTVIPDNMSGTPRVRLISAGRDLGVFPMTEYCPGVTELGLHDTGICNFAVDETLLPGLSQIHDLEIRELDSGLLLYRRLQPGMIEEKYLRVETQLLPPVAPR